MRFASVSYFWFLPSLRLFRGDNFITRRICAELSGFSRAAVYETLVPCVNAVGFPSAFTSSGASGSLFTGNDKGKRRSSLPCPFTEAKRAALASRLHSHRYAFVSPVTGTRGSAPS